MLVIVLVLVAAIVAGATVYILSQRPPTGVTLDAVTISGGNAMDQAALLTLMATAVDTEGRAQTGNATWTWSATPADAVEIRTTGVPTTVQVFGVEAGSVTIRASATWGSSTKEGTHGITVNALTYELTPSVLAPVPNENFTLFFRVLRTGGEIASAYTGTITFSSTDPGAGLPEDYPFSVGDGGVKSFEANVSRSGSVTITAQDTDAAISGSTTVTGNRAPSASFTLTPDSANPLEVEADGSSSSDPDQDPLSFEWDFGDGNGADTEVATNTYAAAGSYTVTLTVTDPHGASDTAEEPYDARAPPTASFRITGVTSAGPDIRVSVDASASGDADGSIASYTWDWGDGNSSVETVPTTRHDYAPFWHEQIVTIVLTVKDNENLTASDSEVVRITLTPLPPTASFTFTLDQATRTVSVDASASTDLNANIAWYLWSWGDGSPDDNVTAPDATATHQYAADGNFEVNLTVGDTTNLKGWDEQVVTIAQPQVPPTAIFTATRTLMHVDVDASASFDLNDDIATYEWDFDEDSTVDATGVMAGFDYPAEGQYTISLVVTDAGGREGSTTRIVSVARTTIDYRYHDFFNVEFGEWWDIRLPGGYGDLPIDAECFNATSIADGICSPSDPAVDDVSSYPYTNWYPLPGQTKPGNPTNNPLVYAPYRFNVIGMNVSGYDLYEPVFLPVFNYGAPVGDELSFRWYMQYLDLATSEALTDLGCIGVDPRFNDGFYIRSQVWLEMDLEESMHLFGVPVGSTPSQAQTWWNQNTDDACGTEVGVEADVSAWFEALGGPAGTTGKYDIVNSFEYQYTPFYTNMTAVVDSTTGMTQVYLEHAAWGTEVLLARMFYWGNASYADNYLDSTKAEGWWGMELAWFEDMTFQGSLGQTTFDFTLDAAMQYHFQLLSLPGSDGNWNRVGDIAYWTWGPILTDYTNDYSPSHLVSELDRYPSPPYGYIHTTPGSARYNQNLSYDYAPIRWDLKTGQTWHFEFPSGDVVFYDPNTTPLGADPTTGNFVDVHAPLVYHSAYPAGYGVWDEASLTWEVFGPAATGGPAGSPGDDGTAGTEDDAYALTPWGSILLVEGSAGAGAFSVAPMSVRSGAMVDATGPANAGFQASSVPRIRRDWSACI